MVKDVWTSVQSGHTPLERWQAKIRSLRQYLRGWAKHTSRMYKKEKKALLDKLERLDKKAEMSPLSSEEINLKHFLNERLVTLLREEELKWYQRAKVKKPLRRRLANGKHRKTRIYKLEQQEGIIQGDAELKSYITKYYKNLFAPHDSNHISLEESQEVRRAIFDMKQNTAPGPDGFPPEFYQVFWNTIKDDLMAMFTEFHKGSLPLHSLNFGTIILLPKGNDVKQIQQYRPICLLNVGFKVFTKVVTNRVVKIATRIIKPTQTAFLPGRNIMEGAVILHETIHELHTKKQNGIVLKIDFEKAYDKVRWDFLQQSLRMKGFSPMWCSWVHACVQGEIQGDPLSLILFNIVSRAKSNGQVHEVVPHLIEGGLSILQYADDTVLFLDHDLEQAKKMKMILCMFEELSCLKINFHKSEIFCFGQAKECESLYSNLFGCKVGEYPFRYLVLPMHFRKLNNKEWKLIEDRIEKKLSNWKGKMLSYGGILVLLNSVISSLPMFMISFFEVLRGILKKIDYFGSRFFWQNDSHKKKYRLIKWPLVCLPKDLGGLGVQNLEIQNKCLLSKCLFKLCNEEGMWQELIKNKYLKGKPLVQVERKLGDSHFWRSLLNVKDLFLSLGRFKLVIGNQLRCWEDKWLGNHAFKHVYPNLFNIVRKKHATVADVFRSSPLNISFRRALVGNKLQEWHNLVANLMFVNLEEGNDTFVWGLNKSDSFSVKSMYNSLINNGIVVSQEIWHLRIPLKITIFLWFLKRGVLLTKDNLSKRNWIGRTSCEFCN
ncbi:hypothetical protein U9M48_041976 [Paspalum notatum var. saurae]|uniref:Reverse transcriptase domain-containing protein n=1 Tax=Paspalum notatum var. saurae TaxID=547442 RepID=A0AAQ3XE01_PASNO